MRKILCMLFVSLSLFARAQIRDTICVQENSINIELDGDGYHHIRYGSDVNIEAGAPELPIIRRQYYIPKNASNLQLEASILHEHILDGAYNVYPSQGLLPMNMSDRSFIELDENWMSQVYPGLISEILADDMLFGYRVVTIGYYPFEFNAMTKKLSVRDIEISLNYAVIAQTYAEDCSQYKYNTESSKRYIENLVENTDLLNHDLSDMELRALPLTRNSEIQSYKSPTPDFVIITNKELESVFQSLADWKTKRGIFTHIETTEFIDSEFVGADLCEKIRNYIIEKESQWGSLAILLGGGIDIIPSRLFNGNSDYEVSDIYYIDRNVLSPNCGTTPSARNVNSIIGRFPVNNIQEAQIMIDRTLSYEKAQSDIDYNYIDNYLMGQALLNLPENSRHFKDGSKMDHTYNKTKDLPINCWYLYDAFNKNGSVQYNGTTYTFTRTNNNIQTGAELTSQNFLDAISDGHDSWGMYHFIYHFDHSYPHTMGTSELLKGQNISCDDVENLNCNEDYLQVMLSLGCHPADFRVDCIAHSFLTAPNNNVVAFMGNTDVGWQDEYTMTDVFFDKMFNANLKYDWDTQLGWTWLSIIRNGKDKCCRFHLLGDPTLHFWTEPPVEQFNNLIINSTDSTLVLSRENSLIGKTNTICLYKKDEIYIVDTLCNRTQATYDWKDIKTPGYLYITSTGIGMKPYTDSIYVGTESLGLEISDVLVRDIVNAYTDDIVSEGESCTLRITYRNKNQQSLSGLTTFITCDNPNVEILSSPISMSTISGGSQVNCTHRFKILPNTPKLSIHDNNAAHFHIYVVKDEKTECVGHYYLEINDGFDAYPVQLTSSVIGSDGKHNINIQFLVTSDVPFIPRRSYIRNCNNENVIVLDTMKAVAVGVKQKNESFALTHRIQVPGSISDYQDLTFNIILEDVFGNTLSQVISPFRTPRVPLVEEDIWLYAESDFIDINWPEESNSYWYIFYSTDGENYVKLNTLPMHGNNYRHENLKPLTRYYYKLARVESGVLGGLSSAAYLTSNCNVLNGFPKFLSGNNTSFRGLTNSWDVDLDGQQEIFASYWSWETEKGGIVAVKPTGVDLYESGSREIDDFVSMEAIYTNGPAIGELYDDGEQYVVGSTYSDSSSVPGHVSCHAVSDINNDGLPDLHWEKDSLIFYSPRSPLIADLDNDDNNEIIVPSAKGKVFVFNADGSIRATISASISYRQLAVANIVPDTDEKQLIIPNAKKLQVYNSNGSLLPLYSVSFDGSLTTPTICDWDNDGYKEAVVCERYNNTGNDNDTIVMYSVKYLPNAVEVTKLFECPYYCIQGRGDVPIVVGDLNTDGFLELVFMSGKYLYIYNHQDITKLKKISAVNADGLNPCPVLADIDGDDEIDIVYIRSVKSGNSIYAYLKAVNNKGETLGLNHKIRSYANDALLATDVDGDGYTEIAVCTYAGNMIVLKTNGSAENIEWGYSRGNPQNTGEYGQIVYPEVLSTGIFSASTSILERDLYVVGDNVTITDSLEFAPHHKIVVWGNGVLNIDGAILNNARIVVKPGGRVNVTNGAIINLRDTKSFVLPKGARLRVTNGKILN